MHHVIVHYHIFKNAGTTLEYILDKNFGSAWARFDGDHPNCLLTGADLLAFLSENPRVMAVSSHQLRYPKPQAEGHVFFDMFFLRDPIDRLFSIYRWFRRIPPSDDFLSRLAKERSMGEFIGYLVDKYPHYLNDVQVNFLANGGTYYRPPGRRDLDAAIEVMLRAAFPGVVDAFDMSWIAAAYFLTPSFPNLDCRYVPHNTSTEFESTLESRLKQVRDSCTKALYRQLCALNELDAILLQRAREEVRRRFRLVPDHARKLSELKTAVAQAGTRT